MEEKTFVLEWKNGEKEEIKGYSFADAFTNAGYGKAHVSALSYWREVTSNEHKN